MIKYASSSGQITLLTRIFGRGSDFICRDQIVAANGGVHVIQTFLSEELSEEVQIKGRTARQGESGSYSLILLDSSLEKFSITKEEIENLKKGSGSHNSLYDLLNQKRNVYCKATYEENRKFVEIAKKKNIESQQFLENIFSKKLDAVKLFLKQENKGATESCSSKTICLMDATGSMSHLLQKAKNTVGTMFERASDILNTSGLSPDSFQMQFAVYRNYNVKADELLQVSPWESKPDNLREFMKTIDPEGGMGNEAIEIGLWHANREVNAEGVSQVILIGDAAANTVQEVSIKRTQRGENYWKNTKFNIPMHYQTELQPLISEEIPVHAFYVDKRAESNFREISSQTGGRCEMLDINSSSGAQMLTDLITEEILRNVGNSNGQGDNLVKQYQNKFGKSYK